MCSKLDGSGKNAVAPDAEVDVDTDPYDMTYVKAKKVRLTCRWRPAARRPRLSTLHQAAPCPQTQTTLVPEAQRTPNMGEVAVPVPYFTATLPPPVLKGGSLPERFPSEFPPSGPGPGGGGGWNSNGEPNFWYQQSRRSLQPPPIPNPFEAAAQEARQGFPDWVIPPAAESHKPAAWAWAPRKSKAFQGVPVPPTQQLGSKLHYPPEFFLKQRPAQD